MNRESIVIVAAVVVFGGLAWVAMSQEMRPPREMPPQMCQMMERGGRPMMMMPPRGERDDEEEDGWAMAQLGRTVKLTFTLAEQGKDDQNGENVMSVLCATRAYSIATNGHSEGREFGVKIDGRLLPPDVDDKARNDDKAGTTLTFDLEMHFGQPDSGSHVEVEGSMIIADGKDIELARFGKRSLIVRVDEVK